MPWRPGVLPFCPSWPPSAQRPMLRVASGVSRAAAGLGNSKPIPGAAAAAECLTPIRQNKTPCSPFLNDPLFAFSPPLCASKSLDTSSPPPRDLNNSSVSKHQSLPDAPTRAHCQRRQSYLDRPTSLGLSARPVGAAAITSVFLIVTSHCPRVFVARNPHHNGRSYSPRSPVDV